jgi:hypothetical protein
VFSAPWEARALGLAAALRAAGIDPAPALAAALAADGADADADPAGYWTAWLTALVDLAADAGVAPADLAARVEALTHHDAHDHDHHDDHHDHDHAGAHG